MMISKDDYTGRISDANDFKDVFEIVKDAVYKTFKLRRVGLSLLLQDMPSFVGAYHVLGSNYIVVNRYILNTVKHLAKSKEEYNAYVFVILVHEYLHSLGIVDEYKVRRMTYELCNSLLGKDHAATIMAKGDPSSYFPELRSLSYVKFSNRFEIVREFDTSNISYIA
jgi:hypothetical protein